MSWFRNHRHSATGAALFALFLQLFLSFGHVHVPGGRDGGRPAATAVHNSVSLAGLDQPQPPPHQHQHSPADDLCAICLVSGFLASAQIATPPALPPPPILNAATPALAPKAALAESRRFAFRSRAPPQA